MSLPAAASATAIPLTEAQSGLWYAARLDAANPLFNTAHYAEISGPLDIGRFKRAVDMAMREAEGLALRMVEADDGPRQYVDPAWCPRLGIVDLSGRNDAHTVALAAIMEDAGTPLDLIRQPPALQRLYMLAPDRFVWYQRIHHLVIDGYGTTLLNQRIAALYAGGNGEPFAPLANVLKEDAEYRQSAARREDADYWWERLAGLPENPGMVAGLAVSAAHFHRATRTLSAAEAKALETLAAQAGASWPDALTALVGAYAQRFADGGEIVLGVPYMGRFGSAAARVPAMVMNVLPLRLAPETEQPVTAYLAETAAGLAEARRHGRYRGEQIRRDLGRIGGQRRLYGPLVNVLPFDRPPALAGLKVETTVLSTGPVDDITFTFRGDPRSGLRLEVDANPNLYEAEDVEDHAQRLLAFIEAAASAERLGDIPTVPEAEARALIAQADGPARELPETTLTALLTARMEETPEAVAVRFEDEAVSYGELDRRSAALAARLREMGVKRGSLVAVALPRSIELVVALVAILRAGGAYLPLDPAHPPERLARIAALAKPVVALAESPMVDLPLLPPADWPMAGAALVEDGQPEDAAYVIYTSGSTGEPKGVVIEHRAIINRLLWMAEHYGFDASDVILQKTPATFDVSVWEFFLPLLVGGTLAVAAPGAHRDPASIAALVRRHGVTTMHFVPAMLAAFLAEPAASGLALERVFCSGEELTADLRDRFHRTITAELHNLYGPTEAAVDVSYWPAGREDASAPVPIGFPVWNTRLYVLDEQDRPVPPGVTGHLHLGGIQLARGYLGRPDLTDQRFRPDPLRPGERIYDSGDLARLRRDGAVIYLGRSDQQVKLRGLRIELGEIEAVALETGLVRQAVAVMQRDGKGPDRLVAYVVPAPGFDETGLRDRLLARLPDYMVPAAIVPVEAMPVTANGKLDRAALPMPHFTAAPSRAPESETEKRLAGLFVETLDLDAVPGVEADFFALGGDSLSAVNLLLGLREQTGHDPGLGALFAHPTIAALATVIDREDQTRDSGLGPMIVLGRGSPEVPPVFAIHPAGGLAWSYRHLAQMLGPERGVIGLQAPALDPACPLPASLEALAEDYIDRVLGLDLPGPVHLVGWSVGGLIAQAMAVGLRERGRQTGLVALLDAYPAECWRAEPEPDAAAALRALLAIAGHDPTAHPELNDRAEITAFLRESDGPLGALPDAALDGVIRVVTETNRLVRNHYHRRYDGTLTHIRAGLDHEGRPLHPEQWAPYAAKLDPISVPYLHAQLTGPEATGLIGPELRRRLDIFDRKG